MQNFWTLMFFGFIDLNFKAEAMSRCILKLLNFAKKSRYK